MTAGDLDDLAVAQDAAASYTRSRRRRREQEARRRRQQRERLADVAIAGLLAGVLWIATAGGPLGSFT